MSQHFLSGKRIAIAGAGLAGPAFAVGLRKQWPSTCPPPTLVLYERDTHDNAVGRQGYSLSLRSDSPGGLQALQKLGLLDATLAASVVAGDETHEAGFCLWDRDLQDILKIRTKPPPGLSVSGARIARNKLRTVMVDGVKEAGSEIIWGVGATGISRREDGRLELQLSNGETDVCDLVVAADGGNSKIRNQLRPDDVLEFRNISCLGAIARLDGPIPKPVDINHGMVVSGTGTGLFFSPVDEHSALWNLSLRTDSPRVVKKPPLSAEDTEALLAEARTYLPKFTPLLAKMIDASDPATLMVFNAQDKAPFRHTDPDYPDVLYLGDANHAVTPFAGNGANMALADGWDMARLLCASSSLQGAIKEYDDLAVPRSTKVWKQSHFNMSVAHATGWRSTLYITLFRVVAFLFFNRLGFGPSRSRKA